MLYLCFMYALTVLWQCYEYEEVEEKEWRSNSEQESGAAGEEKKKQRRLYYNNHSGTGDKQIDRLLTTVYIDNLFS